MEGPLVCRSYELRDVSWANSRSMAGSITAESGMRRLPVRTRALVHAPPSQSNPSPIYQSQIDHRRQFAGGARQAEAADDEYIAMLAEAAGKVH